MNDPSFERALEKRYLAEMRRRLSGEDPLPPLLMLHEQIFETALYGADKGRGGLRFRRLDHGDKTEARLLAMLEANYPVPGSRHSRDE